MPKSEKRNIQHETTSITTTLSQPITDIQSLLDCYDFLCSHEYHDDTLGLLAWLLRKGVGEVNYSAILNEVQEFNDLKEQAEHFVRLLEETRQNLIDNDASIEKCLMLNRWITWIQENEISFATILHRIRHDMRTNLIDNHMKNIIEYPADFREREVDFIKRRNAQNVRRLFYFQSKELKEPINFICLQNKVTAHLSGLFDNEMKFKSDIRTHGHQELEKILNNSFMIIDHPHSGAHPVTIGERIKSNLYETKVSVTIVSLLHDFMIRHPNVVQLYDVEVSLQTSSTHYQLETPRSIPWNNCRLHISPNTNPQMIQYAKLTSLIIQHTSSTGNRNHFSQSFHQLQFSIRCHININDQNYPKPYLIVLKALPFISGTHTSQIPQLLTRVILHDIQYFSKANLNNFKTSVIRYFIYRTGVKPCEYTMKFLEKELLTAINNRQNFQTFEDIYMDILVPIVHQIEFMGKHPILAMLYADGLFIGPCNSNDIIKTIMNSSNVNFHKIALRFNSIKIDYNSIAGKPILGRAIPLTPCNIRVDIYNNVTKILKHYTLDSKKLFHDLNKLILTVYLNKCDNIRILSNICEEINKTTYKSTGELGRYYNDRLQQISKTDERYLPLIDLIENLSDKCPDMMNNMHTSSFTTLTSLHNEQNIDYQIVIQNILSLTKKDLVQNIQLNPELYADLIQHLCRLNTTQTNQFQTSPTIILDQNNSQNSTESFSVDEMSDILEENSLRPMINNNYDDNDIDITDFLTRDPILVNTPNNNELQLPFDDLINNYFSS